METPHNQTLPNQTRIKVKSRKFKENFKQWKDYLTIIKKHWMETNKMNQVLTYTSTNNITKLNQLIYAKFVSEKIGIIQKARRENQNKDGNFDWKRRQKKSTKTGQNDKTLERLWNILEQKGKGNTGKNNNTTWENTPESTGERRKIKEISTKGKTIQTKQDIPKQRKKILSTTGRR